MDKKNVYRNWTAERWNLFSEIQIDPVTNFMILFKQKAFKKVFHKGNVWGDTQQISREIDYWVKNLKHGIQRISKERRRKQNLYPILRNCKWNKLPLHNSRRKHLINIRSALFYSHLLLNKIIDSIIKLRDNS